MNNIFVFTATGPKPKAHLEVSINHPVKHPYKTYVKDNNIIDAINAVGECYCWGNTAKSFPNGRWLDMEIDDYVLCYQDGKYTHFSQVIGIEHNKEFSELIWGYWEEEDKWWEYMYFLKKPQMIDIHWRNLPEIRSLYTKDGIIIGSKKHKKHKKNKKQPVGQTASTMKHFLPQVQITDQGEFHNLNVP